MKNTNSNNLPIEWLEEFYDMSFDNIVIRPKLNKEEDFNKEEIRIKNNDGRKHPAPCILG